MRLCPACTTLSAVVFLGSLAQATEPVTLSLRWLDKKAYVANVSIDGEPTLLQVGTYNYDTWVACSRFGDHSCDHDRSVGSIDVESGRVNVSYLYSKTLSITDADSFKSVAFSNSASMMRAENGDINTTDFPLVGDNTRGVLGLGPANELSCSSTSSTCANISLYLSSSDDGAGSFVQIGGDTNTGFNASGGSTMARYSMPVRNSDVPGWQNKRWYLSLIGVRFGDNKPMYPRIYSSNETVGGDAKALVSLNHATLQMPRGVLVRFLMTYMRGCDGYKSAAIGWYYECARSFINSLPQLSLYVADKVFYLDPSDYTHVSSSDTEKLIVFVATSAMDDAWVLGAPFLRKFPTVFSADADTIEVFCTVGSSCRVQSEVVDRQLVNSSSHDSSGSSSSWTPVTTAAPPSNSYGQTNDSTLWIMWIAKCMGFIMVFVVVARAVRRCRSQREAVDRQLAGRNDDTGTVASERDLEETKEDLRRMQADEEAAMASAASLSGAGFVALQSPSARPHRILRAQRLWV